MNCYMTKLLTFFLAGIFLFLCNVLEAATIVVNPGGSIQAAVDQANAGDIILVSAGTYNQKVLFSGAADSGSAGSLITLRANGAVIIDGTGLSPSGREGLITVSNASFIRIEGFEIRNFISPGSATPVGIYVSGTCNQVQIVNNRVHNIRNNSTCQDPCGVGAHGIGIFGTTTGGITNILIEGNEVYNNILQASEAFVLNGNVDGFQVLNNNVHDNNNIGFDFIGFENECGSCPDEQDRARNGLVAGNRSVNNRSDLANPWYGGDASAGGFYVDGGRDIVFERNQSYGNNMGFEFASEHNGKNTENITMRSNYVANNTEVGVSIGGSVANADAVNISITNNTFYKNHGWGSEIVFQRNVVNSLIANNIFYADNAPAFENQGSGHSNNTWSNNLYFNGAAHLGNVSQANPRLADPDNNNLDLLSNSPARDIGTNLTTAVLGATDIKGNARIFNGTVDLGAHEFGSGSGTTQFTLTTNTVGQGSIALNPSGGTYNDGTVVSATATPAAGWQFIGWSGATTSTTSPVNITMNASKTLTATFEELTGGGETLTIQAEDVTGSSGGDVSSAQTGYIGSGYFDMGGTGSWMEYTFNAQGGSYNLAIRYANGSTGNRTCNVITNGSAVANNFVPTGSWTTWINSQSTVSLNAGTNTIRIQVTGSGGPNVDQLVLTGGGGTTTQYTLTTSTTGQGSVALSPSGGTYNEGTSVNATASPAAGWQFTGWSGAATGTANPVSITMNANKTLTATFTQVPVQGETLTIQAENFSANSGGATSSSLTGYTGTGYFDMGGTGSWMEYTFNAQGGSYNLAIRYANGSTANRACNVITNGSAVPNNFAPSGSWTTWINSQSTVSLNAGSNTIRIQVTGSGGPNVDQLVLTGGGSSASARMAIETSTETETAIGVYPSPVENFVTLKGLPSDAHVQISTFSGQPIKSVKAVNGVVDVSDLSSGLFILRAGKHVMKFVKK